MNNNDFLKSFAQKAKRRLVGREEVRAKIKVISNEDAAFKSKVTELLSVSEVVSNPVHYLMDDKAMKNMNDTQKERYLLATLDKYSALKKELENSHSDTRFCM